jgi:hypothetical protein
LERHRTSKEFAMDPLALTWLLLSMFGNKLLTVAIPVLPEPVINCASLPPGLINHKPLYPVALNLQLLLNPGVALACIKADGFAAPQPDMEPKVSRLSMPVIDI